MDVSTVSSAANNSANADNTKSNASSNQLIADDIHLQSHQQKSQQLNSITVNNRSVNNSFANNIDNFNNSCIVQNYDADINFPNKTYRHDSGSVFQKPDQIQYQNNQNDCQPALCDADLVTEVYDILVELVMRVNGELFEQDSTAKGQPETIQQSNHEQIKVTGNLDDVPLIEHQDEDIANTRELTSTTTTAVQDSTPQDALKYGDSASSNSDDVNDNLVIDSVQPQDPQEGSPEQTATTTTIRPEQEEVKSNDHPDNNDNQADAQQDDMESSLVRQPDKSSDNQEKMQIDDDHDDSRDEKTKDIITLRNLEISPPPVAPEEPTKEKETTTDSTHSTESKNSTKRRRTNSYEVVKLDDSIESSGRSKRQRKQTKLFQAGDVKPEYVIDGDDSSTSTPPAKARTSKTTSRNRKRSSTSASTSDVKPAVAQASVDTNQQVAKIFEKNDFLAIRNENNSFYLCQLAEDVDASRTIIKVRWLDVKEGEKLYFLTSDYDKIPQASIIMPIVFADRPKIEKKKQYFELEDDVREAIMERLKRSLNMTTESISTQESGTDVSQVSNAQ